MGHWISGEFERWLPVDVHQLRRFCCLRASRPFSRQRLVLTYLSGPVHEETNQGHGIQGLGLDVLQQPAVHPCLAHCLGHH